MKEGIKLLNTWLEGERSIGFCRYLSEKSSMLKPNEIPHSETWPFFVKMLIQCISLEISSSKKRLPKLNFAKTLRIVVQRAEDDRISDLVLLYMEKVEASLLTESFGQLNPKEDAFRFTLTLQSLLENPPGDISDDLREDIIKGFVGIFSHIRDEGKVSRKLLECINTYLLKDGPNLGCKSLEIHEAVKQFVFRFWFATHDRSLKDSLVRYAKLQISLTRGMDDGTALLEQFQDVICKELDQMTTPGSNMPRSDSNRDEKCGLLTNSQYILVELAALIFCRVLNAKTSVAACTYTSKAPNPEKRVRQEHVVVQIKGRLMEGQWSWHAVLFCLIRNYSNRLKKDLFIYWFESISANFERIINNVNLEHAYDGFLWTLRSLLGLSSLLLFAAPSAESSLKTSIPMNEVEKGWHVIWSCLMRSLPTFVNVTSIVDAALMVLCNIMLMGDPRDALYLRQNMLRAVLALFNLKEFSPLNELLVVMVPTTAYALCVGSAPLLNEAVALSPFVYLAEAMEEQAKAEEQTLENPRDYFECSVEVLSKIRNDSGPKNNLAEYYQHIRLPRKLREQMLHEMEISVVEYIKDKEIEKMLLSEVINICALLSNFMYCSYSTRIREEFSPFFFKLGELMLKLLDHAIIVIEKTYNDVISGCLGLNSIFNSMESTISSFKSFVSSPLINKLQDKNDASAELYPRIVQSTQGLLNCLAKLYEGCSGCKQNLHAKVDFPELSEIHSVNDPVPTNSSRTLILDMELDINSGSSDVDSLTIDGDQASHTSSSLINKKLDFLTIMSGFFSILPSITWEILFNLMEKESDQKVLENFLVRLCKHPYWSSDRRLSDLIMSMKDIINVCDNLKLQCSHILGGICSLVGNLLHLDGVGKLENVASSSRKIVSEECLITLGNLVHKVSENSFLDWYDRAKLVDCICNFVSLRPQIAQLMIEKLFTLLRDPDFRVRFCLARRIGVLFQTWDGHFELFQDVCSNFGMKLVSSSGEKIVKAEEVLAVGPQPSPIVETTVITLMHLVLHSEKIELEAVFMVCVVAAIDPYQRELVGAMLDSLSKELCYINRTKYMEELLGPILFRWVACGVSLVALVESRGLFVLNVEPNSFVQYCCQWLLPALVLQEDDANLKWVAKVACQPCADLLKYHFVHIFSICMAVHCSKKAGWDKGSRALRTSILHFSEISEHERDELIKKRMVSIVNHIFSLASSVSDPPLPLFSKSTIACAIQTVVDGFLDSANQSLNLVDKIHIFRPDRFIVDMHYKVTAAAHHTHKRNHLAAIEVLVDLLGCRAALPSTFNYLLNLIGQFIGCHSLMDQCCYIISTLLNISRDKPSGETTRVLGEQLQFLVSKLVQCCIPSKSYGKLSDTASSQVVSLLQQLTIGSDPSLYEYIKELEPFPENDTIDDVRRFHQRISQTYSPRVHILNKPCLLHGQKYLIWGLELKYNLPGTIEHTTFVLHEELLELEISCYTFFSLFRSYSCFLFFSHFPCLKTLHKHMSKRVMHPGEDNDENVFKDAHWHSDNEIVHAAWNLVQICSLENTGDLVAMVSDFISRVGIDDPHRVVFHLPGESHVHISGTTKAVGVADLNGHMYTGMSDEVLLVLMRLLKKYLMDESVEMIDMTSHALRGILSTEKGQRALLQLDSYERSLIEVHSKGVNLELVESLLANLQRKFSVESIPIEDSTVWTTFDKTFEAWICPLVHTMITYCDDLILRLCQDIVLVKSEVAELLFSNVIVNVAGRKDSDIDLCKVISLKVQEYIFIESNALVKSIQIFLCALNELRLYHVMERTKSSAALHKLEGSKHTKHPGTGLKSRSASTKKGHQTLYSGSVGSTLFWEKVYWLAVDYLIVAKSAINCGSYFTAVLYVEHWCEEHFNSLTMGSPDFSHHEILPPHIEILVSAVTQINEPDSLYGIIQSHKLTSQIITFEHEGNWSKALEYYDLQVRSEPNVQISGSTNSSRENSQKAALETFSRTEHDMTQKKPYKGLIRSLQQIGCTHVLDVYCQGLASQRGRFQHDLEFTELQYEAAWRAGNWDFCPLYSGTDSSVSYRYVDGHHFNENLHSCLRALQEGEFDEFHTTLQNSKQALLLSICHASKESTEFIYSTIVKLQIFYHLGMAWDLRWSSSCEKVDYSSEVQTSLSEPVVPSMDQLQCLHRNWNCILKQAELHMNLLEPFIAFRRVLLQVLNSMDSTAHHLLESASILRKGSRISQAAAALHEFKFLCSGLGEEYSNLYWLGRLEEAKLLRAQGQHEMAINLADHISQNHRLKAEAPDVFRLVGKWLAETRSSNSRTILEKYLKTAVNLAEDYKSRDKLSMEKRTQIHFHLAHYADALFRSYEERLNSNEWQVAMRLRKHKGDKTDYSLKIQELRKQLAMDREEAEKLQEDRDNFLSTALEGYKRSLIIGEKYDVQVVFRLVSLWFSFSARQIIVDSMLNTIKEVQSYKFILLVYQIASRMGGTKDSMGPASFQFALVSLVKKMALDHPYHTIFQLLALSNGDRIKDKQRSRNSFVVDVDKKVAAEDLLKELLSYHGAIIRQMKQMVEIYIKLAELETKREDTNKKVTLPRELRSIRELELVPVITSNVPVDRTCQYLEGSFPHFKGLADSVTIMNGINAPKVVECLGSDGQRYRQLAKSGNDDLRQDAVWIQIMCSFCKSYLASLSDDIA
ncbi:hypothetical protein RD792_014843 [Penstemon davidsonii]|uniref:Non-specific serine/threonine protein kinase n=1 Tax=Penstemon davidsonii TaxID=160366 RepID=A0ABR0CS89_9LAMI|nr:hypothetical protein RD792_014843 [Penstemon davidsonii]